VRRSVLKRLNIGSPSLNSPRVTSRRPETPPTSLSAVIVREARQMSLSGRKARPLLGHSPDVQAYDRLSVLARRVTHSG